MEKHVVRIIETETERIEKYMKPATIKQAEKIEDGINRNLNHGEYHTDIVPEEFVHSLGIEIAYEGGTT